MFRLLLLFGFFNLGICVSRQYHFINENKTWTEAQRYCRENYVDLVTINNTDEELALTKTVDIWNSEQTWIGLYDDLNSWKWSLNDDSFYKEGERSFRNWYIKKPRNRNSLCVYVTGYNSVWQEDYCSSILPFICFDGRANATDSYVVINQYMTWIEAQTYCRQHHTDLISVRNESENQKIRSLLNSYNNYYYGFWIGLYRTRSWSDKSNSSFNYWKPGQPYTYTQNESCTAVAFNKNVYYYNSYYSYYDQSSYGKWTDDDCSKHFPFICYSRSCRGSSCTLHQYHFINENKTWTEAQRYCRENYTDLATFDNMEEMNTLLNTVNGSYSGLAWIGLYDDLDSWRWSLDNDTFYQEGERDYRGWYHQPDNYNGKELCVYIGSDGTWFDTNCNAYFSVVCYDGKNETEEYRWINQYMTWTEAQSYCRRHYTDLPSVRNQTDNQRILNLTGGSAAWIGLYRTRLWSDKQESTYENWRPYIPYRAAEPNNGVTTQWDYGDQHCTAVSFRDSGHWTDENCFATLPFICYNISCTGSSCTLHQFHFINENKTWTDAQRYCRDKYTDLATIDNMEEMNILRNTVNDLYTGLAWIGLYDNLNSWKWSLDDDTFYMEGERNFRNWYINKPLYWYGNQMCVFITSFYPFWLIDSCSLALPFICFDGRVNASESYIVVNQFMNWTEAQRYCREHYTDLISVRNETENQKIRSILYNFRSSYFGYNNNNYYYYYYHFLWIGLYRTRSWSDKSNTSFSNWKLGQPDNYAQSESCTAVSFNDSGKWTDENCVKALPFLCYSIVSSSSHQYYFVNENKTWTEAQRYCRENYTDLATIDNMEEMNNLLVTINGSYSGLAWIGLYDDPESWRWSLDNDTFYQEGERDYRGWSHQPDNYNGNEMCVSINSRGEWFDQPCTNRRTFVCYNGTNNTYVWIYNSVSWEEAQRYCRVNHRDLASVRNETELQRILNITNGYDVWIGLYRNRLWSDQSSSNFTYWRPYIPGQTQEPDNGVYSSRQYGNQHCTAVDRSGQWTDEDCFGRFPFICYTAFTPGVVTGLRVKAKAEESLTYSEVQRFVLIEFQEELKKLGLSSNVTVNVKKISKLSP